VYPRKNKDGGRSRSRDAERSRPRERRADGVDAGGSRDAGRLRWRDTRGRCACAGLALSADVKAQKTRRRAARGAAPGRLGGKHERIRRTHGPKQVSANHFC
jgi:hypothetical protein